MHWSFGCINPLTVKLMAILKTWRATGSMVYRTALWDIIWHAVVSSIGHLKAARETAGQNSTPKTVPFATCTFPTMHLICLPPPPPSCPKFYITFVSYFSWVLQPSLEKMKTILMQHFGGQIRCIMGDVANS